MSSIKRIYFPREKTSANKIISDFLGEKVFMKKKYILDETHRAKSAATDLEVRDLSALTNSMNATKARNPRTANRTLSAILNVPLF